eukprot:TRINITY_DN20218_c0_g1_i3.p1 TRINITY_DN20218_c0_g1~~TRINITY_DN20218_c0_g1_i3.p1  ORF type:complete len:228 (+),score=39.96 TRINITY_DN20218_c0_g1_i3:150-833(+)
MPTPVADELSGMWEVGTGKKKPQPCQSCGDGIRPQELCFVWCPFEGPFTRSEFHTACAVKVGSRGKHAKVQHASVRKALGLPGHLRGELEAILNAFEPASCAAKAPLPPSRCAEAGGTLAKRRDVRCAKSASAAKKRPSALSIRGKVGLKAVKAVHRSKSVTRTKDGHVVSKSDRRVRQQQLFANKKATLVTGSGWPHRRGEAHRNSGQKDDQAEEWPDCRHGDADD